MQGTDRPIPEFLEIVFVLGSLYPVVKELIAGISGD
jgi:hypothetical protein